MTNGGRPSKGQLEALIGENIGGILWQIDQVVAEDTNRRFRGAVTAIALIHNRGHGTGAAGDVGIVGASGDSDGAGHGGNNLDAAGGVNIQNTGSLVVAVVVLHSLIVHGDLNIQTIGAGARESQTTHVDLSVTVLDVEAAAGHVDAVAAGAGRLAT